MKIAYIVPSLANRGPIRVVHDLVEVMLAHGHKCVVFYLTDICELTFRCQTEKINFLKSFDFYSFDVVHSHGLRPDIYVCLHKPLRCSTLCISTMHNFIFKDLATQYNRFLSLVVGNLWLSCLVRHNKIVVLSHCGKDYYRAWFPLNKLCVAYNTTMIEYGNELTLKEKRELLRFKGGDLLIGVNALLTTGKGIDQIIKALPLVNDIKLWIVGDGKVMADLHKLALRLKVNNRVYFAGYRLDAYRYLPYYNVYAMPSRSEGFGLSLLEAAACRIPAICSDIAVFKEIFTSNEVAFFTLEDTSSLVEAIKYAMNNLELAQRMYQKYLDCYSPEKFYERYISIYQSLL
ncbi:MAG: glycosyltransferase family 4 protein [Odoribacter sp.]|nr:glycosyltransferase family 4 protein [Odoribacter sp.]